MNQLDSFDCAILSVMQEDASLSYADIGQRVNLSASATLRRVQRMRADGTIMAIRAIADPEKIGAPLTIIVEVSLENEHAAALEGTKQALIDDALVQICYYVTGDADLFVILSCADMAAYKAFAERQFLGNGNIKRFKTTVVMDRVKSTTVYPLSW